MFIFFNRKNKNLHFGTSEKHFFKTLINILPNKYCYLQGQVDNDFILGFKPNTLGYEDSYTFLLNANKERVFLKPNLPHYFIIKNIKVWNTEINNYSTIELDILQGMLGGFKSECINFDKFDFTRIDVSNIEEKHFENKDLKKLLSKLNLNKSEQDAFEEKVNYTYSIALSEGVFYYIDDIGNGDVVAIDTLGNCYLLIHDPGKVIKILNKEEFLSKLKTDSLLKDATHEYHKYFERN